MKLVDILVTGCDDESEVEVRLCDARDGHIVNPRLTQRESWLYLLHDVLAWSIERGNVLRVDVGIEVRYE